MKFKGLAIIAFLVIATAGLISCNSNNELATWDPSSDTPSEPNSDQPSIEAQYSAMPCNEIVWINDWDKALSAAQNENKPIMINFYTDVCPACRALDKNTFSDEEVAASICRDFVTVKSNAGKSRLQANYGISSVPTTVFAWSDGKEMGRIVGAYPPEAFLDGISQALDYWNQHKS